MRRVILLCGFLVATIPGCTDPSAVATADDPWGFGSAGAALNVVPAVPAVCGVPTQVTLIADEVVPAGTVEVTHDESNLYVIYRVPASWSIIKTAVFVGDDPSEIPLSPGGNPRVGKFNYKSTHAGVGEVVWEIPLAEFSSSTAVIAAFAELEDVALNVEGAWGEGPTISPGGNWSMYFTHEIIDCAAETIGSAGGTIRTPNSDVTFIVPAGALSSPVDITIEPATVEEILEHIEQRNGGGPALVQVPGRGPVAAGSGPFATTAASTSSASGATVASGTLPSIEGLIPVEGTLWDFGPDGLQFDKPTTVILKYEQGKLPVGFDELEMGVFVINGVIPFLPAPSTVDPVLDQITATIEHFSYAFAGFVEPIEADLTIARLAESADQIELGQSVTYTAQLGNLGPDDITDGVVYYMGFGDVSAGPLSAGCSLEPPFPATVVIKCDVGAVASNSAVDAPSATLVPNSIGSSFDVWVDPGSAEADDPDTSNNRATESYSVVVPTADIEIQTMNDVPDPADAGVPVKYEVQIVADANQPVVGAQLFWTFPDATFVSVSDPACFTTQLGVTCDLPDLPDGLFHGVELTLQPNPGVTGMTVGARVQAPFGTTDPDLSNNVAFESTTIGSAGSADLSITNVIESADPIELGQTVTYQATIQNFGPDPVTDAAVTYTMFGDVVVGTLQPACTEVAIPVGSGAAIQCDVGALSAADVSFVAAAAFVPQAAGDYTIWVDPGSSATDPNTANNRFATSLTVTGPRADLSIQTLFDLADPVAAGDPITYEVQLVSNAAQDVEGAQLFLRTTEATFVSATDTGCFGTGLGVTCDLPTLLDGLIFGVQITVQPDAGLTELSVIAEVQVPFGTTDPDQNNDLAFETTTIEPAGGPTPIAVGQIIEGTLPPAGDVDSYTFDGVVGQFARIHLSMQTGSTGSSQLRLIDPNGIELYPNGVGGRATDLSSANAVIPLLIAGEYTIQVEPLGSGPYRVGYGTGIGRLDLNWGPGGTGVVTGPRSNSPRNPFRQMEVVGDEVITVGEEHLFRFDANGNPVAGFGTNGFVDLYATIAGYGAALRVQPDGMIVVAAYTSLAPNPWRIARFDANGVLDPTFGTNGIVDVQFANDFNSTPFGIRFQQNGPDLDIVVAGYTADPPNPIGMVRLNPDGSLDTGFGNGGTMVDNAFLQRPAYMDMLSDGRIVIGESKQLSRYTASGARDATFGVAGYLNYGINGQAFGLTVLPGDGMLVMGAELDNAFLLRLTASGAADGSFGTNGLALYDFGNRSRFQAATLDASGNYIVIGHQRTPGNDYEWLVTRLSSSGVLDPNFGIGGYTIENRTDDARDVRFDGSGRLIVGGQRNRTTFGVELTRHIMN